MTDLTVAIPVFNGEKHLAQTLTSVLESLAAAEALSWELLVLDNASTDGTERVARSYEDCKRVRYLRNDYNRGFNFSIERLANEAEGRYIWFLGAQEVVAPGATAHIRDAIVGQSPQLLLLNFSSYSEALDEHETDTNYPGKLNRTWESPLKFLMDVRGPALAMSANVVKRDAYLTAAQQPVVSQNWALFERLLDCSLAIAPERPARLIGYPCFVLYREADGWWTTEAVYTNFLEMVEVLQAKLKGHPLLHQMMFRRQSGRALLRSISAAKRNGLAFDRALIERSRKAFQWSPTFWVVGLPMMLASTHRRQRQG